MQNPKDFGSRGYGVYNGCKIDIVAGSGTDNVKVTGAEINRLVNGGLARSLKLLIPYSFTLADGKVAKFTVGLTDCATSGGSYSTATAIQAATTAATGGTGGSTEAGHVELDIDLSGYAQYLKFEITADLDASGTDAGNWFSSVVLGGFDVEPQ